MFALRIDRKMLIVLLLCTTIIGLSRAAFGQTEQRLPAADERLMDVDVEVQLHVLVASNSAGGGKLPGMLETVARDLRPNLPFSNYRLGASFLNRVKNGRQLNSKGVGRSLLVTPALESSVLPTFYEISAINVNLKSNGAGAATVQISDFRFGLRIPLQTDSTRSTDGGERTSAIAYEPVGVATTLTMSEGEPTVVGTLDAGRPDETLILVLVAKRASTVEQISRAR